MADIPSTPPPQTLGGGGVRGRWPPIFWRTIVFCSKTMEIYDVILPKQYACPPPQYLPKCPPLTTQKIMAQQVKWNYIATQWHLTVLFQAVSKWVLGERIRSFFLASSSPHRCSLRSTAYYVLTRDNPIVYFDPNFLMFDYA